MCNDRSPQRSEFNAPVKKMSWNDKLGRSVLYGGIVLAIVLICSFFAVTAALNKRNWEQRTVEYESKGAEFGKNSDQAGCIQEGLLRSRSAVGSEIAETGLNSTFTSACLHSSRPTVEFCNDIPSMDVDEWKDSQCRKAGLERAQPGCLKTLEAKIDFCATTR